MHTLPISKDDSWHEAQCYSLAHYFSLKPASCWDMLQWSSENNYNHWKMKCRRLSFKTSWVSKVKWTADMYANMLQKKSMAYSKSRPRKLRNNFKWKTLIAYLSISVLWTSKMARIQNDILYTLAWVFLSHEMHLCLFWVFISHQLALFHSSSTR